jgi:hypothetical protein
MHGGAGVLRGDEEVLLVAAFAREEGVAGLMHVQQTRDEISFRGENVAVFPDADDLAGVFQFLQRLVKVHPLTAFAAESLAEFDLVERAVFRRAEDAEDLFLQGVGILFHREVAPRRRVR